MPIPKQLTATRPYLCIFKKKHIQKHPCKDMVWRILEIAAYSHGRSYGHFFPRASNPKPRIKSRYL